MCFLLFLAALARYWVVFDSGVEVKFDPEPWRLARNIASRGQFANPFPSLETGPSAHLAPAYPALLALFIRVFGDGSVGVYIIRFAAATVMSLQVALFPVFSRVLGMGMLNGAIAAIIWISAKVGANAPSRNQTLVLDTWEGFYAAILVAGAACCYRRYLSSSESGSTHLAVLLGCLVGALILTSPTAATVMRRVAGLVRLEEKKRNPSRSSSIRFSASDGDRSAVAYPELHCVRPLRTRA